MHRRFLAAGGQPTGGELADGLQQRIADYGAVLDLHERLAGQAYQQPGDRVRRQGLTPGDPFGHLKLESSAQHRQTGQQAPFGVTEQLIAPRHQCLEGTVPSRAGGAAGQQARVALQARSELRRPERRAPGRGQLDGQRHAIQPGAQPGDRSRVACGQCERRARRAGPGDKQAAGLGRGDRADRTVFRQFQRRYREDEFAGHVQTFPAGGQDAHPAAVPGQHDHHPGGRFQDVLAVVEHDQQLSAGQRPDHARHRVRGISFRDSQRLGDGGGNERGIGQGSQLDQPGAVPEAGLGERRHPQCQPGLAAPAWAGQRDHPAAAEPFSTAAISGPRPTSELTSAGNPDCRCGRRDVCAPPLQACWQAPRFI